MQIAEVLATAVEDSAVVPSEAALMEKHGVSRATIRRALKELERRGLIYSVPGVGWRVGRRGPSLMERVTTLHGELADGAVFPSEAALCERFGMSRTAVRRVLAQLEGDGRLIARRGAGRTVRKAEGEQ